MLCRRKLVSISVIFGQNFNNPCLDRWLPAANRRFTSHEDGRIIRLKRNETSEVVAKVSREHVVQ
jgi:hypothetical protein